MEEEFLLRNPTLKVNEPKRGKRVPKALTIEELELLRDSCKSSLEHALVEFSFASGSRVAEIQRLNSGDIDWQRLPFTVLGKGNKEREIYFGAKARIWVQRYLPKDRTMIEHFLSQSDSRIECQFTKYSISSNVSQDAAAYRRGSVPSK